MKSKSKSISKKQAEQSSVVQHRKQIENTLRQLHVLQSEIYQLNVPENPHSSSPVKKEIKQLSYLYENMTKPKKKNKLNVKSKDIELAMRIMNEDWTIGTELRDQINENNFQQTTSRFSLVPVEDQSYEMKKQVLKEKFSKLTNNQFNLNLLTENTTNDKVSTQDLYSFINYNESDDFDPIQEAYQMFLDKNGKFDINIFNQFNQHLNIPQVKSYSTFMSAIQQATGDKVQDQQTITLDQFRKIIKMQIN